MFAEKEMIWVGSKIMSDQSGEVPREDPVDSVAIEQAVAMIDVDPSSAAARLRDLVDHGSPRAMALLGCAYQQGVGVAVDLYEAESLYRRAEAAGAMEGVFGRGQICLLRKDYKQARVFFVAAQAGGLDEAREALRQLDAFECDERLQAQVDAAAKLRETDPIRAFVLMRGLAEQGSFRAMAHLAEQYHSGVGTQVNFSEAETWYRRVADCGWGEMKARALHNLGWLYEEQGDPTRALDLFQQGADLGYAPSLCHLGYIFWCGLGRDKDPDKARALFEQAVAKGNLAAQKFLGVQLLSGQFGLRQALRGLGLYLRTAWMIVVKVPYGDDRVRM